MAGSSVELDFFRTEREASVNHSSIRPKLVERRRSFRDIQTAVSKINPEVLKAVIGSYSAKPLDTGILSFSNSAIPSTPTENLNQTSLPVPLPVFSPSFSTNVSSFQNKPENVPLTIFYNGTVTVFELPPHQAENILKFAADGGSGKNFKSTATSKCQQHIWETLNGDLPIARTKSLRRFLQKRKERVTQSSPFAYPVNHAFSRTRATASRD